MGTPTSVLISAVPAPDLSSWDPYPTTSCEHQLNPDDDNYIRKVPRPKFNELLSTDTKTERYNNECLYNGDCGLYNFDKIYTRNVYLEHEGYDYYLSENLWPDHESKDRMEENLVEQDIRYWLFYYLTGEGYEQQNINATIHRDAA